jgi:hypothetical protein
MANGPSSFGTDPTDEAPTSSGGLDSGAPANSSPEGGANLPGGFPEQSDANLSAAETNANACFSTDPIAGVTTQCPPPTGFKIEGDDDFRKKTTECLAKIGKTPSGAKMLKAIGDSGQTVTIKKTSGGNGAGPTDKSKAQPMADGSPGAGSGSTVYFNPDKPQIGDGSEDWMKRPACVGLAHELVHAYHNANGTNDFTSKGEDLAVGVPPYDKEPVSENTIRSEWDPKQPARTHY